MKFRGWGLLGVACVLTSGCLIDLYGGDPRLQFKNSSAFLVQSVGIGDVDNPPWKHDLDPALKPEKSSEVIEMPVAGSLRIWIRVSDTAKTWDTVLTRLEEVDFGEFNLIHVSGQQRSELSTSH